MFDENEIKIMSAFLDSTQDYYYCYSWMEGQTGLSRKELEPIVKKLRKDGWLEYQKGLLDEEGMAAGSGYQIPYQKRDRVAGILWDQTWRERNKIEVKTALQEFADWLKDVPKDTSIQITGSQRTIIFVRTDIPEGKS